MTLALAVIAPVSAPVVRTSTRLRVAERKQAEVNVALERVSRRQFLTSCGEPGTFEFVYSAGLYDYLNDKDAMAVTEAMFRSVRPRERLLAANFAPELPGIRSLEATMDSRLLYRDDAAVERLANGIPREEIANRAIARDRLGNVVYLTIDRVAR